MLLSGVTPVLSQFAQRAEALQQRQATLLQALRHSPVVDEATLSKVQGTLSQVPEYHEKLETLQADMLQLARRTQSMRQRSAKLASQVADT